jgi:tyrosinase
MGEFSRRSIIKTGAGAAALGAVPLPAWLGGSAEAAPMVRYEASTPNGQAMLAKYAAAVTKMRALAKGDPCSWTFQWYTHWVPTNTTKAAQVASLPAAQQALANTMWDTCQNHGGFTTEDMFLPWHRMYVYYFEKIIRHVLADNSFTLPYWNYNASATAALPHNFINPANAGTNSLYSTSRNSGPNSGAPLTGLDLSALSQGTYSGFCSTLDFGLHGDVHVEVGNSVGMGAVPWAAYDPIFWMHHCNIDRLWASWNAGGNANPTTASWTNQTFTFANPGYTCMPIVNKVGNYTAIAPLGYAYDRLEPIPGKFKFIWPFLATVNPILLKGPGPVELTKAVTHVPNVAPAEMLRTVKANTPLVHTRLLALAPEKHVYLLLDNLMADTAPGVTYSVYLNPANNPSDKPDQSRYVGKINFFGAVMPGGGRMKEPPRLSFDVTDVLRGLDRGGALADKVTVSIVPDGEAASDAKPMVGGFSFVEA